MSREAFLLSRGWRRVLVSWWYKPLPGWDRLASGQELFGTARAFDLEKLRFVKEPERDERH